MLPLNNTWNVLEIVISTPEEEKIWIYVQLNEKPALIFGIAWTMFMDSEPEFIVATDYLE